MLGYAFLAAALALALEIPLSAEAGAVKQQVSEFAPDYARLVFQQSRFWEVLTNSRVRFAIVLAKPPGSVAHCMSPVRRLALAQLVLSVAAAALLLAGIEA